MIKTFISMLLLFNFSFAISKNATPGKYKDFGVEGEQYEIVEPDFEKILQNEMRKLKITKKNVKKQVEKSIRKAALFKSDLKLCEKNTRDNWEKDFYILQTDLYNPMGRLWKKAGTKALAPALPDGIEKNICIIEGRNLIAAKNQISFFKKTIGDCLYLVNNRDVRDLIKFFPNEKIYPNQNSVKDRFEIDCLPAAITFKKDLRRTNYYDYEYFKTEN